MATFAKSTFSAASYAAFRPSYPPSLYNAVLSYHRGPANLAMDLGCGTGIVTRELGQHFSKVIGIDPSAGMIKQANSKAGSSSSNTEYRQGSAESGSASLAAGSVDCVTAGQAVHWFDYSQFWPEMARVVRRGGTCAFWGYKDHVFVDFPSATATMQKYAYDVHPDLLGSYWPQPGRGYVQDKLRVVRPPTGEWEDVERVEYEPGTSGKQSGEGTLFMEKRLSVGQCKEYMRTWSSYHGWQETHPEQVARSKGGKGDIMDDFFDEIAEQDEHFKNEANEIEIEWGSALIMARRK